MTLDVLEQRTTSALSERTLLRGYGSLDARQCACGDWIMADPDDERHVLHAVSTHNETRRHRAWRVMAGDE